MIVIEVKTVSEANRRDHWARKAKRAKGHRLSAYMLVRPMIQRECVSLPCTVRMTRVAPRALDDDNLRSAIKATRDGIADALGIDDRDPRVTWTYAQRRGAPKQYAVEVEVIRERDAM